MPTNQPSSAPDALPADARDDATAAAVLHDERMDDTPGGGALGGAAAADRLGGSGRAPEGSSPNAPVTPPDSDVTLPDGTATREAQLRSLEDGPAEAHSGSR